MTAVAWSTNFSRNCLFIFFQSLINFTNICVGVIQTRTTALGKLVVVECAESAVNVVEYPAKKAVVSTTIEFYIITHPVAIANEALYNDVVDEFVNVEYLSNLFVCFIGGSLVYVI